MAAELCYNLIEAKPSLLKFPKLPSSKSIICCVYIE